MDLGDFIGKALSIRSQDAKVEIIKKFLNDLGVESVYELSLVEEADLSPLKDEGITVIQIRKIFRAFKDSQVPDQIPSTSGSTAGPSKSSNFLTPSVSSYQSIFSSASTSTGPTCHVLRPSNSDNLQATEASQESSYTRREDWAQNFSIRLKDLSANLRIVLKGSKPLAVSDRRQFVKEATVLIRAENPRPGRANLRLITKNLVRDYPCLAHVTYTGRLVAGGNAGILGCLEASIEQKNKCKKVTTASGNGNEEENVDDPVPNQRAYRKRDTYGCVLGMYCPNSLPDGESKESQENSRNVLLALVNEEGVIQDFELAHQLMSETYVSQRWVITLESPDDDAQDASLVSVLQERWPLIFHPTCANIHMDKLCGINMIERTREFLSSEAEDMIQFLLCSSTKSKSWELYKVKKDLDSWKTCGFKNIELIALLKLLTFYFEEELASIIRTADPTTRPEDFKTLDMPETPTIVALGQSEFAAHKYFLLIDKRIVNPNISDLVHAFSVWFSSFFIMHFQYPTGAPFTLEFIQRQISTIDPSAGTKRPRKAGRANNAVSQKVLTLMSKYDAFKRKLLENLP